MARLIISLSILIICLTFISDVNAVQRVRSESDEGESDDFGTDHLRKIYSRPIMLSPAGEERRQYLPFHNQVNSNDKTLVWKCGFDETCYDLGRPSSEETLTWNVGKAAPDGQSLLEGPKGHTSGHYVYTNASDLNPKGKGSMITTAYKANRDQYCLTMWYYLVGSNSVKFKINYFNFNNTDNSYPLFIKHGTDTSQGAWKHLRLTVKAQTGDHFIVVLELTKGQGHSVFVAVDDFTVSMGQCQQSSDKMMQKEIDDKQVKELQHGSLLKKKQVIKNKNVPKQVDFYRKRDNLISLNNFPIEGDGPSRQRESLELGSIRVTSSSSDILWECDFESTCEYFFRSSLNGAYNWLLGSGNTPTSSTGPSRDHTTGSGSYLFVESSRGSENDTATIISERHVADRKDYCISFWYHINGQDINQFRGLYFNLNQSNARQFLWARGHQGNSWKHLETDFTADVGDTFVIAFTAYRGNGDRGDIAIDDIIVRQKRCQSSDKKMTGNFGFVVDNIRKQLFQFNIDTGAYQAIVIPDESLVAPTDLAFDAGNDRLYWTDTRANKILSVFCNGTGYKELYSGVSIIDGLAIDIGRGLLFFTEIAGRIGTISVSGGSKNTIISGLDLPRDIRLNQPNSHIYYTTWGEEAGIFRADYDGRNHRTIINTNIDEPFGLALDIAAGYIYWTERELNRVERADMDGGNRRVIWRSSSNIDLYSIELAGDYIYLSDWSIESIRKMKKDGSGASLLGQPVFPQAMTILIPGGETPVPQPARTTTVPPTMVPATQGPGMAVSSCDFDGACENILISRSNGNYTWQGRYGPTQTFGTGPSRDHSTGIGAYVYTDASRGSPGDRATMNIVAMTATRRDYCVSVWYHMYGRDIDRLAMLYYNFNATRQSYVLLELTGDQGNEWYHFQTTIDADEGDLFTIAFVATRGNGERGDIAIDDFVLSEGFCPGTSTPLQGTIALVADVFRRQIIQVNVDTHEHRSIFVSDRQHELLVDLAYHPTDERVYWTDIGDFTINSAKLDGTDYQQFYTETGAGVLFGIEIDHDLNMLYFTSSSRDVVKSVNIRSKSVRTLITSINKPHDIKLDKNNRHLYITSIDNSRSGIYRADTSGSNVRAIVTGRNIPTPYGITLDLTRRHMYWCNFRQATIERADLDGTNRREIWRRTHAEFYSIELFNGHLYITDWNSTAIHRIKTDGSEATDIGPPLFSRATGIKIIQIKSTTTTQDTWGPWSRYGPCSRTCGAGIETRTRTCNGNCPGRKEQTQICFQEFCPTTAPCGDWNQWGVCSVTCGNGTRDRTKQFCQNQRGSDTCKGGECVGTWGIWSPFQACSVTCGVGLSMRKRACSPTGEDCPGRDSEVRICFQDFCQQSTPSTPVPCGDWTDWGPCSVTCGSGERERNLRNCPQDRQTQMCQEPACPIPCGDWTDWGTCSVTCGSGERERNLRNCPQDRQTLKCQEPACPIPCGDWTDWGPCSVTCGSGESERNLRNCPQQRQAQTCQESDCPNPCGDWTRWGGCSVTCGLGERSRNRERCIEIFETERCMEPKCVVPCDDWTDWGPCTVTCGFGERVRSSRNCDDFDFEDCQERECTSVQGGSEDVFMCSFESPCDDLNNLEVDDFDWTRRSEGTPSGGTGPELDHTFANKSGVYMYMEASSPRIQGNSAILQTEKLQVTSQSVCLSFWYHMRGEHMGEFQVHVMKDESKSTIWTQEGDKGREWLEAMVSITFSGINEYVISFEGKVGRDYKSDIAIDDVSLATGNCGGGTPSPELGWSGWSDWTPCSSSCEKGTRQRTRICSEDVECNGPSTQSLTCYPQQCQNEWNMWTMWIRCSVTCGSGVRSRSRDCKTRNCRGKPRELEICENSPCKSTWDSWEQWGACSASCGTGVRARYRSCMPANCPSQDSSMERRNCHADPCEDEFP